MSKNTIMNVAPFIMAIVGIGAIISSPFLGIIPFILGVVLSVATIVYAVIFVFTDDYSGVPTFIAIAALIGAGVIGAGAVEKVNAGDCAVVVSSPAGLAGETYSEGWYFNPQFMLSDIDKIRYNTQTSEYIGNDNGEDYTGCITVMSKDGSTINIDISVTFHIPENNVKELRFKYGSDWQDTIINQAVRAEPRVICANYEATQFISADRATIENSLITALSSKIASYGLIIVDSIQIKEFRIPPAVTDAVQAKLIALQAKERAETEAETLKIQAQARADADKISAETQAQIALIEAQGKASAIAEVQAQFTTVEEYNKYLFIQALTDPSSNVQYVVPSGSTIVVSP